MIVLQCSTAESLYRDAIIIVGKVSCLEWWIHVPEWCLTFNNTLDESVCALVSQMSSLRSENVKTEYPVKVKTVVGH